MMSRYSRSVLRASCVAFCVAVALPVFATTYYVDAEKGDDGYDGTSPTVDGGNVGPRKTWAGAIELLSANGDVLKFAKGTYEVGAEFTTKLSSLVIEGTGEKPEDVVFNGKGATRWLRLSAGGHTLRNLTAQNFLSPAATKLPASALFIEGGNASKIESCRFVGCTNLATCAEDRGSDWVKRAWGGAVCTFCPCTVTNSQFIGNFGKYGGGLCAAKSKTYVYDSTFEGNVSTFRSGGLHVYDTTDVVGCTFTSNSVTGGNGGAICQGDSIPTVTDCTFRGNYASGGGGALCGGNITVSDCRFYGNVAKTSGGAFNKNGGVAGKIIRCTFVDNCTTNGQGGAVYAAGSPVIIGQIEQCVFVDNADAAAALTDDDIYTADDSQIGYCYSSLGGGRITDGVNDCIVKPGENPFRADDHTAYAVRKDCGSGAGLKLGWMTADSLDLGGKPRLAKNEGGEVVVDFGCYQFWRKPGLLLFVW